MATFELTGRVTHFYDKLVEAMIARRHGNRIDLRITQRMLRQRLPPEPDRKGQESGHADHSFPFYSIIQQVMAEREGFEPSVPLPVRRISSAVHSTTLPPLREDDPSGGNRWG